MSIELSAEKAAGTSIPFQDFHHLHMFGLNHDLLNDLGQMMSKTASLIEKLRLNVIGEPAPVKYPGQGIGAHYHLSESGLTFYTWPEDGYASFLLHTCTQDFTTRNLTSAVEDTFPEAAKILIVRYNQPDTLNTRDLTSLPRIVTADARISYLTGHMIKKA